KVDRPKKKENESRTEEKESGSEDGWKEKHKYRQSEWKRTRSRVRGGHGKENRHLFSTLSQKPVP
ncbi:unnamed protein product, partial [Ilex paraguariensis]